MTVPIAIRDGRRARKRMKKDMPGLQGVSMLADWSKDNVIRVSSERLTLRFVEPPKTLPRVYLSPVSVRMCTKVIMSQQI